MTRTATHFQRTLSPARRIISITPAEAARLFPFAVLASSLLALAVVAVHRLVQAPSPPDVTVTFWAALALLVAATFIAVSRPSTFSLPARISPAGFTAYLLALELGIALIPLAVFAAVWRNRYDELGGWTYPFLNKRWLIALYGIAIATFLVFPSAIDRWRRSLRPFSGEVETKAAPAAALPSGGRLRRRLQRGAGACAAVAVAWFLVGPPWHVERHHRSIDFHEQVHLGPLQAISKGYTPYIGPASTQYGPGSQVVTYSLMQLSGRFDVVSFRQAQLSIHFFAFSAVAVFACLTLGFWPMLLIVWLAVAYSPLAMFRAGDDGTMTGMYGWGNALRYLGPLIVVPTLGRVASAARDRAVVSIWPAFILGCVWGACAWLSQENLGATGVAVSIFLSILWLSETITARVALSLAARLLAGFGLIWAAVLVYYAAHGAAGAFIRNYFLVAGAVAMGFSNSWWPAGESPDVLRAYYFTAPLLIIAAVATLTDLRHLALRRRLDAAQVRFLAFVCVLLACYQTALYRSDATHLLNPMLALPFVIVLAVRDLPEWAAGTWSGRAGVRVAVVAIILYVYPINGALLEPYNWIVQPALNRFGPQPQLPDVATDGRIAFRRATRYLSDEPSAAPGMLPMRSFLESVSEIGDLIGTRTTYVDASIAGAYTDLYYFILDLKPGPIRFERETMVIHSGLADEAAEHFKRHVREFEAVVAPSLGSREVRAFLEAYPDAVTIEKAIGDHTAFVILARSSS